MASIEDKNIDRISNLPEEIIVDKILSRLSLREAVKTCVLSKKWRSTWVTLPSLELDVLCELFPDELDYDLDKLVSIIDSVLSLHTGAIHRFMLEHSYCKGNISHTDFDRWMTYLSRASLKEFILCMYYFDDSRYEVPSSMYSLQKLTYLHLSWCDLKPPPEFNGFKCMKSLHLEHITMEQLGLEQMIANCTLLENLTLIIFHGFTLLNIRAPNLLVFYVDGVFDDIVFIDTFKLFGVSIHRTNSTRKASGNLVKFFPCLPRIQRFRVEYNFWMNLAKENIPRKLQTPLLHLTFLDIEINLNETQENLAVLCLLRSSPNLKELKMRLRLLPEEDDAEEDNNDEENLERFPLNQLQLVKIEEISSSRRELNLIKLLLENAPVLERMSVEPRSRKSGWALVKEMFIYRRASPSAEVIFRGPAVHRSFMLGTCIES